MALHCGDQTAAVHIFSQSGLFHQASGYFPYSAACGISPFSLHIIQKRLRIWSQKEGQHARQLATDFMRVWLDTNGGKKPWKSTCFWCLYTVIWIFLGMLSQETESCEFWRDFTSFFSVVQESACPVGDEEEAGGGSFAVHSEGWDTDSGSGSGQTGLGKGL